MMYEGYKYYRAIGTQEMKFLDVSVAKIDELTRYSPHDMAGNLS